MTIKEIHDTKKWAQRAGFETKFLDKLIWAKRRMLIAREEEFIRTSPLSNNFLKRDLKKAERLLDIYILKVIQRAVKNEDMEYIKFLLGIYLERNNEQNVDYEKGIEMVL